MKIKTDIRHNKSKNNGSLTILTLNAGLLDVEIFGRRVLVPAPFVDERLRALPKALMQTKADIIALQEIYDQKHRQFLISAMRRTHPHHFYSRQKRLFKLEDSLIFFSKHPITARKVLPYKSSIFEERIMTFQGILIAKVKVPEWGLINFYNFHSTAGGIRDPENAKVEKVREYQTMQMLEKIRKDKHSGIKIVLGDLNAGPEAARENYDLFRMFGYEDAIVWRHPVRYERKTWDPENILNRGGSYKNCPPQRCDHIFFRDHDLPRLTIDRADIVLAGPLVRLVSGERVPLSDHAGVLARISRM